MYTDICIIADTCTSKNNNVLSCQIGECQTTKERIQSYNVHVHVHDVHVLHAVKVHVHAPIVTKGTCTHLAISLLCHQSRIYYSYTVN